MWRFSNLHWCTFKFHGNLKSRIMNFAEFDGNIILRILALFFFTRIFLPCGTLHDWWLVNISHTKFAFSQNLSFPNTHYEVLCQFYHFVTRGITMVRVLRLRRCFSYSITNFVSAALSLMRLVGKYYWWGTSVNAAFDFINRAAAVHLISFVRLRTLQSLLDNSLY